jgi:hypothetical protein
MIERIVRKGRLEDLSEIKENLHFWLSKTPEERIAEVERLRRERDGRADRLQRTARVVQRA